MIVPMAKVQVLGPRSLLPRSLDFLQRQGVLELRPAPDDESKLVRPVAPAPPDRNAAEKLRARADSLEQVLASLPAAEPAPSRALPDLDGAELDGALEDIRGELRALDERRAALAEEAEVAARYRHLLAALIPLRPHLPPGVEPHTIGLVVRRDRADTLPLLEREVRERTGGTYDLQWREIDREQLGVLLTVPRADAARIAAFLFERGLGEVKLPPRYADQPLVRALLLLDARTRELPDEQARVGSEAARLAGAVGPPLRSLLAQARSRLEALDAQTRCGETSHAFVVRGWVPRERVAALQAAVDRELDHGIEVLEFPVEPREYAEVPVMLRNRPALRPFELLLALVPLPRYGTIDPTPVLAAFFPLFFGLVLGDAGFGLLAIPILLVVRRRVRTRAQRDLVVIAAACAVSAIGFGLAFGEIFGAHVWLPPLLFNRSQAALSFLVGSLGLGLAHVILGIALGAFDAARNHHLREAAGRAAHALFMVGAALAGCVAAGWLPGPLPGWALPALGALTAVVVVGGGPLGLLELLLSLGHVLSYARLMALGLASVILADLANRMATTLQPVALGYGLAVLLHAVNFSLGLISPTVCALRLHYVEFFDKFYQAGGRGWRPFSLSEGAAHV